MNNVNVYQQRPAQGRAESPLHHAGLHELAGKGPVGAGVTLREKKLLGHLVIRGDIRDPDFAGGVHQALGLELPGALNLVMKGETSVQWLAPDEWLLIVPQGEELTVEQRLRTALQGTHHAVVNVSGGQTLVEL